MAKAVTFILLVEDEEPHAELISEAFCNSKTNFEVVHKDTIAGALQLLEERTPDLILSDWLLPDGTGAEFLPRDKDTIEIPLVVMTSQGNEQVAVDAMKAGALDYVVKSAETFQEMPHIVMRTVRGFAQIVDRRLAEQALRESEAKFRQLTENIRSVFWLRGEQHLVYVSPAFERIWGISTEKLYADPNIWLKTIHPEDQKRIKQLYYAKKFTEEGHFDEEYRILRPDKTERWVAVRSFPVMEEGRMVRTAGVAEDITERKEFEANLAHAKEAAEAASEAKSQFLANMSHELRTPLNGIVGMTEVLLNSGVNKSQRHYLKLAQDASHRLLGIIEELLELSSLETGPVELNKQEFNLRELVASICEEKHSFFNFKGLDFTYIVEDEVPGLLYSDPIRLAQVLGNLLSNAVKFTDHGSVVVRVASFKLLGDSVSGKKEAQNIAPILFSVQDTGIGIAVEKQQEIFDSFTLAEDCMTKEYGGTGLGLSIAKKVVKSLGGCLWVESVKGQGSTFFFYVTT